MSLLSRAKLSAARPPAKPKKARRPRVFLSRGENKLVNALKPIERKVGYAMAAYVAICVAIIQWYVNRFTAGQLWKSGVTLVLVAVLIAALRYSNRLFAGIAAIACVYTPGWHIYQVAATPLFGLMLFLTFRISNDRRKLIDDHIARGDLGVDPRTVANRKREAKKNPAATADRTGRALASASKRYTPPKAKKK